MFKYELKYFESNEITNFIESEDDNYIFDNNIKNLGYISAGNYTQQDIDKYNSILSYLGKNPLTVGNSVTEDGVEKFEVQSNYEIIKTNITSVKAQQDINKESKKFLNETDYKVLRHLRQKALSLPTTLTEEQYLALEQQRQDAADAVVE